MVHFNVVTVPLYTIQRPLHTPKIGVYLCLLQFSASIGGFLYGYNARAVSSAMIYVPLNTGMQPISTTWQEVIVNVAPGVAAVGSLFAGVAADRYGRQNMIICSSFMYAIGALISAISSEKFMLILGRFLTGIADGISNMVTPVYIVETSPSHIRGTLVTAWQLMITCGLFSADVLAGVFSYMDAVDLGWRFMFGFACIPAGIQFVSFFCLPESPRWLYERGMKEEAHKVLEKIHHGERQWVDYEMAEIVSQHKTQVAKYSSEQSIPSRIYNTPHVRKALLIGSGLQAFQQLCGINTIMYYTGKIIQAAGIRSNHVTIWISAGISGVIFCSTFIPLFLIDRIGRRPLLLVSILGVAITLFLMGGTFMAINKGSARTITNYTTVLPSKHFQRCHSFRNCDACVTDEQCGFCQEKGNPKGYCLSFSPSLSDDKSLTGYCMNGTSTGIGSNYEWSSSFCHTKYTALPIILMVIYLSFFSAGYAALPWVMNSEFYPFWARSVCVSIATTCNWIVNLIISLTFLALSQAVSKFGTFVLYGCITLVALVFVWFCVPETKNCRLDEVEQLFEKSANTEKHANAEEPESQTDIVDIVF